VSYAGVCLAQAPERKRQTAALLPSSAAVALPKQESSTECCIQAHTAQQRCTLASRHTSSALGHKVGLHSSKRPDRWYQPN
jgi:hypothetical protein